MDVIKFPGDEDKSGKATVRTDPDPLSKMVIRSMKFTCTKCHNQCTADFTGLIFRDMEFYCSECGTFYKISNNVFQK